MRRRREGQRGNAFIEFALAMSFLSVMFIGTFQFGYAFYQYNSLLTNVRAAARYAALKRYNSTTVTPSTCYRNEVARMAVFGNPVGGTRPVVPGLTIGNINVRATMVNGTPDAITVSVNNFTIDAVLGQIPIRDKPSVTFPYLGPFAPMAPCPLI